MKATKEKQSENTHNHDHNHNHGKTPVLMYFIGLVLAILALFIPQEYAFVQNMLFSLATITAGYYHYHVIILEGWERRLRIRKIKRNLHQMLIF